MAARVLCVPYVVGREACGMGAYDPCYDPDGWVRDAALAVLKAAASR